LKQSARRQRPTLTVRNHPLSARSFDGFADSVVWRLSVAGSRRGDVLVVVFGPIRIHSGKGFPNGIVYRVGRLSVAPGEGTTQAVPDGPDGLAGFDALPFHAAMSVIGTAAGATGH